MSEIEFDDLSRFAILTGAGFSANWGAPLASDVWDHLFSCAADDESLRTVMWNAHRSARPEHQAYNYEALLGDRSLTSAQQTLLISSVNDMFRMFDKVLSGSSLSMANLQVTMALINALRAEEKPGIVFTLNQDLLLERLLGAGCAGSRVLRPGIIEWQRSGFVDGSWDSTPYPGPIAPRIQPWASSPFAMNSNDGVACHYIKMHGSMDWLDGDSKPIYVMGADKTTQIEGCEVLAWYKRVFEQFICQHNRVLVVIGYGFGDPWVNDILLRGVINYQLKMHVWNSDGPAEVRKKLTGAAQRGMQHGPPSKAVAVMRNSVIGIEHRPLSELLANSRREWVSAVHLLRRTFGYRADGFGLPTGSQYDAPDGRHPLGPMP